MKDQTGFCKLVLAVKASLFSLVGAFLISACDSEPGIIVASTDEASYSEITLGNPFGKEIRMVAGDSCGAIGYVQDGKEYWLKGTPEMTELSDHSWQYAWPADGGEVHLTVDLQERETEMSLSGTFAKPPSMWLVNLHAEKDEYFTGILERVVDGSQKESWKDGISTALNLRGEQVDVKLRPTVSAYAPFYISSANYGMYVHGTWPGEIDFCKDEADLVQVSFEGPEFDFSLMTDSPAELVKRHAMETGPAYLPPKWTFGPWRWRDIHHHNKTYYDGTLVNAPFNSEIVEEVLMMEAYDIPCTAYWIDRPWGPGSRGFDDYDIDYNRLPQFEAMVNWINAHNMELMLWIGPFVMGDLAVEAENRHYHLQSKIWEGNGQVLMDFSNEEACKWWGENGPARLAKMGIKGFKLDRADGEKLADSLHLKTATGISYRENYNDYPRQYVKAAYDAVKPILGNDFVLFPRAQYTGSSKYGAMWAGDTGNSDEGLRSAVIGMQRCAVMGYPIWGSDTGGYPKKMEREPTMRWMGFSCFSPIMEVGPTNNLAFWGMDYEPSFDHELLAIWRFYSKLRMSMIDYVYAAAREAGETGKPIARPLFLDYPDQEESWNDWTTYLFGDDLLVSVIWKDGEVSDKVYLPAGEVWVDEWTKKEYEGGQYVNVDAPLYKIPVFKKKESTLMLPDLSTLYQESVNRTAVKYSMNELEEQEKFTGRFISALNQ